LLLWSGVALANPFDTFGAGARSTAMAGAEVADATGWAAAHHNPAGVALADRVEAALGYGGAANGLVLDAGNGAHQAPLSPVRGTTIGIAIPAALGKTVTAALGVALYLPDQYLARVQLVPASEPRFVMLDNRLHHLVAQVVGSLRIGRYVAVGGGAYLLADASGDGIQFDVGVVNGAKTGSGSLNVSLPLRAAAILGVLISPRPWLRFGATWRGPLDLGLSLDVLTRVDVAGAITGDALISLRAVDLYTPHTVTFGAAVDIGKHVTATAQVEWQAWSRFEQTLPRLDVRLDLNVAPPLVQQNLAQPLFNDTWTARFGLEARRDVRDKVGLAARIGYGFIPSPLASTPSAARLADGDRHVVAFGGGVELLRLKPWLRAERPLRLDIAIQLQDVVGRTIAPLTSAPGGTSDGLRAGGWLLYAGATLGVRF
jgi:hypothetical protein